MSMTYIRKSYEKCQNEKHCAHEKHCYHNDHDEHHEHHEHHRDYDVPTLPEGVAISPEAYEAAKGNYFIGQSGEFKLKSTGSTLNGMAMIALINPTCSCRTVLVDLTVISSYAQNAVKAVFYLQGKLPFPGSISQSVHNTNSEILPSPVPMAQIQVLNPTSTTPTGGVAIASRAVAPGSNVEVDFDGKILLAPGESLIVELTAPVDTPVSVVFDWWEKKRHHHD